MEPPLFSCAIKSAIELPPSASGAKARHPARESQYWLGGSADLVTRNLKMMNIGMLVLTAQAIVKMTKKLELTC